MRRPISLLFFAIAIALPMIGAASDKITQNVKIEFGYALQPDGTKRSLKGMVIPITLEPIDAKPMKARGESRGFDMLRGTAFGRTFGSLTKNPFVRFDGGRRNVTMAETYVSDTPSAYFYIDPAEFSDPSSLDGINMVGGAGRPWTDIAWGLYLEIDRKVLLRIRCYSTYNSAAPAGTSAFSGEFADFGFYIQPGGYAQGPNHAYSLSTGIGNAGVVSPNNQLYMALQYRLPHPQGPLFEDGEQPFDEAFRHVYSAVAPTVGTSEENFWFDWDPLNGIYTNEEFDVLGNGQTTFPSNFLFRVQVSDTGGEDTLVPINYTVVQGRNATGSFVDLWYSDDNYVQLQPTVFAQTGVPPLQVRVESIAQSANAQSLKFRVEAASLNGASTQRILLWNFVSGQYDLVDTRAASGTDTVTEVHMTSNPSKYIDPNNRTVRALMQYSPGIFSTANWRVRFDRTVWLVVR
jgi:hypothetical protein